MSPAGSTPVFVVTILNWAREIYDFAFYPGNPREPESICKVSIPRIEKVWGSFLWHQKSWSDLGPGARFYSNCPGQIRKQGLGQKNCHFHFVCCWFWDCGFGVWVVVYDPMEGVWSMPVMGHHLLNRRVKPWLRKTSVLLSISSYFGWRRKDQVSWQRDYGWKAVVTPCLWRDLFD